MSDNIIARLRADWPDMNDARDAADEITRLRSELAAGNAWIQARASVLEELAKARADLAAAQLSHIEAVRKLTKTIADLQNELANAREAIKDAYFEGWEDAYGIESFLGGANFDWSSSLAKCAYESSRLDAALKGDGDE